MVLEQTCKNHPEIQAVAKCTFCEQPICDDCMIFRQGSVFCGPDCSKRSATEADALHKMLTEKKWGLGDWLFAIVGLAVIAAVAVGVLEYFGIVDVLEFM